MQNEDASVEKKEERALNGLMLRKLLVIAVAMFGFATR